MMRLLARALLAATAICGSSAVPVVTGTPAPPAVQPYKFVHISDIHLDLLSDPSKYGPYQFCRDPKNMPHHNALARTWKFMQEDGHVRGPMLLLKERTNATLRQQAALHRLNAQYAVPYGWMLCDSYPSMVDNLFANMAQTMPNPDFMVITGDWVAHLQLSLNTMFDAIKAGVSIIKKNFPNTIVVPAIGNNDVFPDYNQTSCYQSQTTGVYMLWSQWIPQSQVQNFLNFGGFETHVHGGKLRIFSVNTVFYHLRNKAFSQTTDPCGQMAWLTKGLAQARADGARVIVTGHIPPKAIVTSPSQSGYFWWPKHQKPFMDMLHSYEDIITTTLWGHTHHDEFWVDQRAKTTVAGLIAPSITPLPSYPSYRIGKMAQSNYDLLDYVQRYVQLSEANHLGKFDMQDEYSFAKAYNITDLTPQHLVAARALMFANPAVGDAFLHRHATSYKDILYGTVCSMVSDDADYWKCQMAH